MHSTPSENVAQQVRRCRERLNLTRDQLAAKCAEVGAPQLTKAALTNIETGRPDAKGKRRRDVTAEELFAFAYVLGVHPVDLLIPSDAADDEPYSVTPEVTTTASTAREWVAGRGFLQSLDSPLDLAEAIRFMPKSRAREVSREWFTPERQREMNRAALDYDSGV